MSEMLKQAEIQKYTFTYFYDGNNTNQSRKYIKDKALIALTKEIDIHNTFEDDKILLFMPQAFAINFCPLFDPNQLSIYAYFYTNFDKKSTSYPLYEFDLDSKLNKIYGRDNSKVEYFKSLTNIDINNNTLEEHLVYAYSLFYERVRTKVEYIQSRSRL